MLLLLILLLAIIGGYQYLTDSNRVRRMAQSYLSDAIGGRVEIGSATLSIFQGLRLDDVRVRVDKSDSPESVLFSAQTFLLNYDPRSLIEGNLQATQIIVLEPRIHVVEDLDKGGRNYQRLRREPRTATAPSGSPSPIILPEILLRNAQVEYAQIEDGHYSPRGSMRIEGRLSPLRRGQPLHL